MYRSPKTAVLGLCVLTGSIASYVEDYVSIQNTLALYPFAIDSKDFGLLNQVFTQDIVANYSAPLNVLTGLAEVQNVLQAALAPVTSQHGYTTQKIDIHGNTANTTTYFTANQFGRGPYEGQVVYSYGKYIDQLVRVRSLSDAQLPQWLVHRRTLAYMGPNLGNLSIFLGPDA